MDRKDQALRKLSRTEHIKEEARRALEFGQSPKRAVSLDANFRVEGLIATSPPSPEPPSAEFLHNSRMEVLSSRSDIPATLQSHDKPEVIASLLESQLQRIAPGEADGQAVSVLDTLARLQTADSRAAPATLRRKVFATLFGDSFAKSEQNLSKDATEANGGKASDNGRA